MVHNFKLAQDVTETVAMTTAKEAEEEFSKVAKVIDRGHGDLPTASRLCCFVEF